MILHKNYERIGISLIYNVFSDSIIYSTHNGQRLTAAKTKETVITTVSKRFSYDQKITLLSFLRYTLERYRKYPFEGN